MLSTKLRLASLLALVLIACATCATAFAQSDEGDCVADGCETSAPALPYLADDIGTVTNYTDAVARGIPWNCGQAANPKRQQAAVDCKVELKVLVSPNVAKFIGLHSRVLAAGVASKVVDHYANGESDPSPSEAARLDRAYLLAIPASVKAKLKAKRVRAIGVQFTGSVSLADGSKAYCASDGESATPVARTSCPIVTHKKLTIMGAEDGELVCWRYMPWGLATPATWGKMCPRPKHI